MRDTNMKLLAEIEFDYTPSPNTFEHAKYIAEKELNRSPYLRVKITKEAPKKQGHLRPDEV